MTRINSHQVIQMVDDERLVFVDEDTGVEVVMPVARAKTLVDEVKGRLFDANTLFGFHDGDNDNPGKNQVMFDVAHMPAVTQAIEYFAGVRHVVNVPPAAVESFLHKAEEVGTKPSEPDPYALDEFFVTFGVQYGKDPEYRTPHPLAPETITGEGYVVIEAPDESTARAIAFGVFDRAWAFIYSRTEFGDRERNKFYPEGELGRITINFPIGQK